MPTYNETPHNREWIESEANGDRSRSNTLVEAGSGVVPTGTPMIAGGGSNVAPGAVADGANCVGILLDEVDASGAADVPGVLVDRDAEVTVLAYPAGASTAQIAAYDAALLALGIKVRPVVTYP